MSNTHKFLASISAEELGSWLKDIGEPSFREKQIIDWIYHKRVLSPEMMKNIPEQLRIKVSSCFNCNSSKIIERSDIAEGTVKLLIELADGEKIESVIIPSNKRMTFCLSTQVGCPVMCRFCSSGVGGLVRNLNSGEIIEQLFLVSDELGSLPDNIVFMGIGEGLLNFDNLLDSLNIISDSNYIGMSPRRITVSTSGWTQGIIKLADCRQPWNLAISLHATDDRTRKQLIPDKFRKPISDIIDSAIYYRSQTNRMVTFEYTIISGINDSIGEAVKLADISRQCRAKVNLIPYNQSNNHFKRPPQSVIKAFYNKLLDYGVQATLRIERGSEISAACGQLRISARKEI